MADAGGGAVGGVDGPEDGGPDGAAAVTSARLAGNRERQRELYGVPLGERVRRINGALGISQARLARTIGLSPAMLSQLVSARRVKIGDPAVLARLLMLDQRCHGLRAPAAAGAVDALLGEVARARWQWNPAGGAARGSGPRPDAGNRLLRRTTGDGTAAAALRGVSDPARLAAAAAALGGAFPELAEVLRQAASRPGA
jgi:transcriptional regulator with XRE-family HTH domain